MQLVRALAEMADGDGGGGGNPQSDPDRHQDFRDEAVLAGAEGYVAAEGGGVDGRGAAEVADHLVDPGLPARVALAPLDLQLVQLAA
ncbi:hypothetical protein GCM10023176_54880 [Micromonospora coerulea]|uniref:Uncharacterized protein n=1 Tax=Micromonospora coerulea TaxID=47856 RepID=A0ABP8T3F3_9ACTN